MGEQTKKSKLVVLLSKHTNLKDTFIFDVQDHYLDEKIMQIKP